MTSLITERLRLRRLERGDAERVIDYLSDRQTVRMLARVPQPYGQKDFDRFYAYANDPDENEVVFAIEWNDDPGLLGVVSLHVSEEDPRPALGFWLGQPHRRQGVMREAAIGILRHGFETMNIERVKAGYYEDNEASGALQAQLGFLITDRRTIETPVRPGERVVHVDTELSRERFVRYCLS